MSFDALTVADTVTGLVLLGCAVPTGLRQPRLGLVLALAGLIWFLGDLVPALVLLHRGPLVHLHMSYPTGRVRRPRARVAIAAAYVAALGDVVFHGPWLSSLLAVLVAVAAWDVFHSTSGPARKAGGPALVAACAFSAAIGLGAANALFGLEADRAVLLVYEGVVCLAVCWLTLDLRYGRWSEATLADLVTQLGARREVSGLQDELRRRLADPTLVLGLREPGQSTFVDDRGDAVETPDSRAVTPVLDGAEQVAVLVHDPILLHDPALLEGAVRAVSLVVANARGRRDVAARGALVAASSRGIVEAADAQRTRLQEELELGAQRHLREVDRILQRFGGDSTPAAREQLRLVRAEVATGLNELRQLATGIRPATLTAGGLGSALPPLAVNHQVACQVTVTVGRLSPAFESAVYFVCSEALTNIVKHAEAAHARLDVVEEGEFVVARVVDDGCGGADPRGSGLRGLSDRITALGGTLTLESEPGAGTTLEARLPRDEGANR